MQRGERIRRGAALGVALLLHAALFGLGGRPLRPAEMPEPSVVELSVIEEEAQPPAAVAVAAAEVHAPRTPAPFAQSGKDGRPAAEEPSGRPHPGVGRA